ncbi:MAG TPA: MerC domain-containing protein [Abditibacterium sp.]|jgi:hypothetical protein
MLNFVRTDDASGKTAPKTGKAVDKLDSVGATASFLCAIHCALMPFIITILPLVGLGFLASEPVEWGLLAASGVLGTLSLCVGFREHRRRRVFGVLGIALAFLAAGRIFHEHFHDHPLENWGIVFMVLGGLTMMSAHLLNRLLCRSCRVCSHHGCCS